MLDAIRELGRATTTDILAWMVAHNVELPRHRSCINQRLKTLVARNYIRNMGKRLGTHNAIEWSVVEDGG